MLHTVLHGLGILLLGGDLCFAHVRKLCDIGWSLPKYHSHDSPILNFSWVLFSLNDPKFWLMSLLFQSDTTYGVSSTCTGGIGITKGSCYFMRGHMEYFLGAGISNCGQLGPSLTIPAPKFGHPILVSLNITALAPILIILRLIILGNG